MKRSNYGSHGTTVSGRAARAYRIAVVAVAVGVVAALTSCTSPTEAGNSGSASNAATGSAGIAKAKADLKPYYEPPTWKGPTETVDISGLKGKKVVYINVSSAIPVLKYWSDTVAKLVKQNAGVQLQTIDAKGSVGEANKGFKYAIAKKADVIVLQAFFADMFKKQISEAKAAGIKVITANSGVPGKVDSGQAAEVSFDYVKVGQLIGDWFIVNSKGHGKGLLITSDDVPASQAQAQGTISQVKKLCPSCDLKVKDVQIPQWETSIPTLFRSTINSDPTRTYLLPIYDGQALSGLGAIRTAGAGDKVSVLTFNATDGIVQQLKDPTSGLKLDIGGDNQWWAYAAADTIFRVLSDTTPVKNYHVGLRIFDTGNKDLISGKDQEAWYGYDGYKAKFLALWKK